MSKILSVDAINISEFPFVASLPKSEKKKLRSLWDQWEELKQFALSRGHLIPTGMAHTLAGVSRNRVYQLIEDGRLERYQVGHHSFITEESLIKFVESERKSGRPPSSKSDLALARDAVKGWQEK